MLKKHNEIYVSIFVLADALSNLVAFGLAYYLKFYHPWLGQPSWVPPLGNYLVLLAIELPVWLVVYQTSGHYRLSRGVRPAEDLFRLIKSHVISLLVLGGVFFFYRQHSYSREMIGIFCGLNIVFAFAARFLIRNLFARLRRRGYNMRRVLVMGAGDLGLTIVRRIEEHSGLGYKIIGFLDDDTEKNGKIYAEVPVLGRLEILDQTIQEREVDEVIFALPLRAHVETMKYMRIATQAGVRVRIVPDYFALIVHRAVIEELDGIPLIGLQNLPLTGFWNRFIKRSFDLILAVIITVIILPILLLIAILVKLSSPGPLLFVQERVGLNQLSFNMYKFRTMSLGAEQESGPVWAKKDDPRTTKLGKFLRQTSLDELPQLLNVIKGDMSLIGPRPERPFFVEQFKEEFTHYMQRHQVKEGITGWAQVNGWRGNTSLEKRVLFDIYYIENWSFFFDLKILWLTLWKGFINKNAY